MSVRRHKDPFVNELYGYVASVDSAVSAAGLEIPAAWLDPYAPRDATIRLANSKALVFDEVSGWQYGEFISGEQGIRTVMADIRHLGGGLLPAGPEVAYRVINGLSAPRQAHRSWSDEHDGFEDQLRRTGQS
jgi:hypothetical protein